MRHYNITAYTYIDRKFVGTQDAACWAVFNFPNQFNQKYKTNKEFFFNKVVYIADFDEEKTKNYQSLLVKIINKITPCKIIKKPNGKRYIRIRLLKSYDQSLIILNFIRNLWHEPDQGYTERFFENLKKAKHNDGLEKLTWANKESCDKICYSPGHSNVHNKKLLKVKNSKELIEYKGTCTYEFLTK